MTADAAPINSTEKCAQQLVERLQHAHQVARNKIHEVPEQYSAASMAVSMPGIAVHPQKPAIGTATSSAGDLAPDGRPTGG